MKLYARRDRLSPSYLPVPPPRDPTRESSQKIRSCSLLTFVFVVQLHRKVMCMIPSRKPLCSQKLAELLMGLVTCSSPVFLIWGKCKMFFKFMIPVIIKIFLSCRPEAYSGSSDDQQPGWRSGSQRKKVAGIVREIYPT